jgi:hypothetical protein
MSHPASQTFQPVGLPASGPTTGEVFRLHPVVRGDVLAGSGFAGVLCMGLALISLQSMPEPRTPLSLLLVLAVEVIGLGIASGWALWALGLTVRADDEGIRCFNMLFPRRPGRCWAWQELAGTAERPWLLSRRAGYPSWRLHLVGRDGVEAILPPLDRQQVLLELARRSIDGHAPVIPAG